MIGDNMSTVLETYTALADKGTTVLQPVGRYITIWQISKDERTQRLWLIEQESNASFRDTGRQIRSDYFSDNVYNKFEKIQNLLRSSFLPDLDIVELVLAPAS